MPRRADTPHEPPPPPLLNLPHRESGPGRTEGELKLLDELYNKYARGGTKFANFRVKIRFLGKKYAWIIVTQSTYFLKRTLDIVISGAMLLCLSPLFILTGLAIKLEDFGPIFYSSMRIGKWGKPFTMYKLRSMILGADKLKTELLKENETGGIIFKMKRDPRITRVGKIIRKLSIDELPQLWNVLKGDMSLVGPRPSLPNEVAQYDYTDRKRLDAIPGITCIWQVSGRSSLNFEQQVRLDVQYIESQSFWGDVKILFKTVPAVLFGKGAY
jgi:lipopolysaccharide/colanic/teichoic acid biosynthesis glycosyltransferase